MHQQAVPAGLTVFTRQVKPALGNDRFRRLARDLGRPQAVVPRRQFPRLTRLQGMGEGGIHSLEVLLARARQMVRAVAVPQLEKPAVAVVADHALRADQIVGEMCQRLAGRVPIGETHLGHRVRPVFVVQVQPHMVRRFIVLDPSSRRLIMSDIGVQPPARKVYLVDAAVHHRPAFLHAPVPVGVGFRPA